LLAGLGGAAVAAPALIPTHAPSSDEERKGPSLPAERKS
jgi:hypothetical protein